MADLSALLLGIGILQILNLCVLVFIALKLPDADVITSYLRLIMEHLIRRNNDAK